MKTYGQVCQQLADWIRNDTNGKIDLTEDDIFELDITFPALILKTLSSYMDSGQNAADVLVSDPYCAKRVMLKLNEKGKL